MEALAQFAQFAEGEATLSTSSPLVLAELPSEDAENDVLGAAFALQLVDGEVWLVRGVLQRVPTGPPVMKRVAVEHLIDTSRDVTGKIVREIRFGEIRDAALARLRERGPARAQLRDADPDLFTEEQVAEAQAVAVEVARHARGPRGAYTSEHYRHVARRYLALVDEGRRDVVNALCEEEAERLGEPIARERMRDWIRKATRMGFLAPGTSGVIGRQPGPNLDPKEEGDG